MSNFTKVLSKLSSERGYSWRFDGEDPTTEAEYNSAVDWHDDSEKITWAEIQAELYKLNRADEYPDFRDYLDGIVKGDTQQVQEYIDACNAVKLKYPKPE